MKQKVKNTSENFDRFIRSKLDEVEVDPLLADAYWQQMQLSAVRKTGANKFRRYYWLGASVLLTALVITAVTKSGKKPAINSNATVFHQQKRVPPINTHDTVIMINTKGKEDSPIVTESQQIKENGSGIFIPGKSVSINNPLHSKPTYDSTFNHQTTATLHSLNPSKEIDTAGFKKESLLPTIILQTDTDLKKMDSSSTKSEVKKKAPYIIW